MAGAQETARPVGAGLAVRGEGGSSRLGVGTARLHEGPLEELSEAGQGLCDSSWQDMGTTGQVQGPEGPT